MRQNPAIGIVNKAVDSLESEIAIFDRQILEIIEHGVSREAGDLYIEVDGSEPAFSLALMGLLLNGSLRMEPQLIGNGVMLRWLSRGLAADLDALALAKVGIDPGLRFASRPVPPETNVPEPNGYQATAQTQAGFAPQQPFIPAYGTQQAPTTLVTSSFPPSVGSKKIR